MESVDVLILGAGGAGMMCAWHAAQRGLSVLVVDQSAKFGGKIPISGGGKCNFTNWGAGPGNYVSSNPHFCKSALSRYPVQNFVDLVQSHRIPFEERKHGQLFCLVSAQKLVDMLQQECEEAGVRWSLRSKIEKVTKLETATETDPRFEVQTTGGVFRARSLVVATGGLSIPKMGASGVGYDIARQFGLTVTALAPALDGLVFSLQDAHAFKDLAGISIDAVIECNGKVFREAMLFTHAGLSGPVSLQASLHWYPGDMVTINTLPDLDSLAWLLEQKRAGRRNVVKNLVGELLPARLAERLCDAYLAAEAQELPLPQVSDKALAALCSKLHAWAFVPAHTVGYGKAEVTRGGVDTDELSSKTLEARKVPGLYFIGEVVDVTGWLGGFNYQWAWASGWAAAQSLSLPTVVSS